MVREDKSLIELSKFIDVLITLLSFVVAYYIKIGCLPLSYRGLCSTPNYYVVMLLSCIIWYVSLQYSDLYIFYFRKRSFGALVGKVTWFVTVNTLILILVFYFLKIEHISRIMIGIFYVLNIILLAASRKLLNILIGFLRKKKSIMLNVLVVVGSKQAAKDLIAAIHCDEEANIKILGCLDFDTSMVGTEVSNGIKVIGTLEELEDVLTENVVDEVIFAMPVDLIWNAEKYFSIAESVGVQIRVVPHWHLRKFLVSRPRFYSMDFEEFQETPTFVLSATPQNRAALLIKSTLDYLFAFCLLVVLAPVLLATACAIKLASPGAVFFKQIRSGLNGRRFSLYKFRSMVANAEEMLPGLLKLNEASGPVFKIRRDPRIIPYVGTFIRKTSLDELPQLINVLRGEMSLVGPRPPIPEEVTRYHLWERRRLSMKPGITCLWQIHPQRNEIPFEKWMQLDLKYIDNWSLWLDFKILCRTASAVLLGRGR